MGQHANEDVRKGALDLVLLSCVNPIKSNYWQLFGVFIVDGHIVACLVITGH